MALIRGYRGAEPLLARGAWLAENAAVIGDVEIGEDANIWYGCVVRGDVGRVRIGRGANLQDMSCVHMTEELSSGIIGDDVSIGHGVIIHGAVIEAGALIGMGSVLMDNVRIGEQSIVGAGSLLTANTVIPPRSMAFGRPARVVRPLSPEECLAGRQTARKYVRLARTHEAERESARR